jgi:hypothetical protein
MPIRVSIFRVANAVAVSIPVARIDNAVTIAIPVPAGWNSVSVAVPGYPTTMPIRRGHRGQDRPEAERKDQQGCLCSHRGDYRLLAERREGCSRWS